MSSVRLRSQTSPVCKSSTYEAKDFEVEYADVKIFKQGSYMIRFVFQKKTQLWWQWSRVVCKRNGSQGVIATVQGREKKRPTKSVT